MSNSSSKAAPRCQKAYNALDRFSEDIDLTYDIRHLLSGEDGLAPGSADALPPSGSKARKWTEKVRERLPRWITDEVEPLFEQAIQASGLSHRLDRVSPEGLKIWFDPLISERKAYVEPTVLLEFGARSTGEPAEQVGIACDAAFHLPDISFPTATPRVMALERTFWEKATAAHVYCVQAELRGERFARHWHDLAALARHPRYEQAVQDRRLAETVARHKAMFFRVKDPATGTPIDYLRAVRGNIRIVPDDAAAKVLEDDYLAMAEAGLLHNTALPFSKLMEACRAIEEAINRG